MDAMHKYIYLITCEIWNRFLQIGMALSKHNHASFMATLANLKIMHKYSISGILIYLANILLGGK